MTQSVKISPIKKKRYMSLEKKRGIIGFIFLLPWILGFLLFFVRPFGDIVSYAFSYVELGLGEINLTFVGLDNFRHIFTVDPFFNQLIITLAYPALVMVAIVVIFSLLAAMLINGKYPGRSVIRTIFFIPIIMGANIAVATIVGADTATAEMMPETGFGAVSGMFFIQTLAAFGLPIGLTAYVSQAIAGIFGVLADSGVPVLIFLAGLQAIPPSMYEVAKIEGASAYETFWKVTLPMISPMILLSTVYTVIDLFTRHSADIGGTTVVFFNRVQSVGFDGGGNFGLAGAMVLVYVAACLVVIGLVTYFMSKVVFYYE